MATFRERSGRWQVIVKRDGKQFSKTFLYQSDAKKWAADLENKIDRRVYVDLAEARETTLSEAMKAYRIHAEQNLKGWSAERYRIDFWIAHRLSCKVVADITAADIDRHRLDRKAQGVTDATIRNELATLRAAWTYGDFPVACPTTRSLKLLKTARKRDRRLSKKEEQYLMAELENTGCSDPSRANRWIPLIARFAIATAARAAEILSLKWEDVHLSDNLCQFINTKNGRDRWVPLSPVAIECLKAARQLNPAIKGSVFKTTLSAIKQSWARAKIRAKARYEADCAASGVPIDPNFMNDFRFHDCRHEAASRWANEFGHHDLKAITGHLDDRSLSRYVNKSREDVANIARRMARA